MSAAEGRRIGGLAIPVDVETEIGIGSESFLEVITPGAIDLDRDGPHMALLWSHDPARVLARSPKTLRLSLDEDRQGGGLFFLATLGASATFEREAIERRDVTGMSFGFYPLEERWRWHEGRPLREIVRARVSEISAVLWPAYPNTRVQLMRSQPAPRRRTRDQRWADTRLALAR